MGILEKKTAPLPDFEDGEMLVGKGIRFERIRRITGYLVGTLARFNNAKLAEVKDRVMHMSFSALRKDGGK